MLNSAPSRTVSCGDGLTSGGPTYYFPHLAVGASWQTTITYINYSREEVTCQTDFISDHGTPLMVSFAELGTVDSRTDVLPPGGSVHQETDVDLSAPLAPGWARANCSGPVQASLLFRWYNSEGMPVAEAGVNAATVPATRFVTFAEQGEGKNGTGVAYANPSDTAVWRPCLLSAALPDRSKSTSTAPTGGGHVQGSARKDAVFGAARVYTFTVPGPKWKSWLSLSTLGCGGPECNTEAVRNGLGRLDSGTWFIEPGGAVGERLCGELQRQTPGCVSE